MQYGSVVLSLLLLAGVSQAQFGVGVGLGAGAAALGAAVVGGAALGVLGAAIAGRGRRGGSRRFSAGRRRGRGRRAALDQADDVEDVEEQSVIWGSVAAADQDGCALKLICLLEAAEKEASDDERTVLTFFGDLDATKKTVAASKLPYEAAGWLGQHRGAEACEVLYGASCPFGKDEMMQLVSSVWADNTNKEVNKTLTA
ncbi:uncharacterized protein LOC122367138 [Amphibalanus amphitrite]|uniref:uncharacterized protein LOC122367138 n=1 Tax=Amphibalanus amphitrite TaxID=1232801 RepID=UPI001C913E7E|nr:uncharacterized protein LOC122367138 [Amphibalanus amphitrite]